MTERQDAQARPDSEIRLIAKEAAKKIRHLHPDPAGDQQEDWSIIEDAIRAAPPAPLPPPQEPQGVTDHKLIANECHDHGCHFLFLQRGGKCSNCTPVKSVSTTEFRKAWSHKPTPISAESSGLFYSEECTDELMEAYAASRPAARVYEQVKEKI